MHKIQRRLSQHFSDGLTDLRRHVTEQVDKATKDIKGRLPAHGADTGSNDVGGKSSAKSNLVTGVCAHYNTMPEQVMSTGHPN